MQDVPLNRVPGWTPEYVERAGQSWITTADQVVALLQTDGGLRSLAQQLQVSEEEATRLASAAGESLSPARRAEMEEVVDTSDYGLGVIPPREEDANR
jgi:hypothetical protein